MLVGEQELRNFLKDFTSGEYFKAIVAWKQERRLALMEKLAMVDTPPNESNIIRGQLQELNTNHEAMMLEELTSRLKNTEE